MPVHDVGYRGWDGKKSSSQIRWWTIAKNGVVLTLKSKWIRRVLLFAWASVLYWGFGFFMFEKVLEQTSKTDGGAIVSGIADELQRSPIGHELERELARHQIEEISKEEINRFRALQFKRQFPMLPNVDKLAGMMYSEDQDVARHQFWSWMILTFLRYPQGIMTIFLLGFIGPTLISSDIRSRAFLLYFSRPIGRLDYLFGKFAILAGFLIWTTTIPAILLYAFGILLSPDISVLGATWDIPFRVLLSSAVLIVPTCLLVLTLSALTQESRYAFFAWFSVWVMGESAWRVISGTQAMGLMQDSVRRQQWDTPVEVDQTWSFLSLYNSFGNVQTWIFAEPGETIDWYAFGSGVFVLTALTTVCAIVLFRRITIATQA